ncbi:unnamed protein product [Ambrosiozyma monospora]|uniref:Unnamed protein product n=1 Tax=Ambrosiozyma monospora TaxID=43982 RepID=A0A9W6Z126_AMBMO|nr:unnamed protein product [Ambrosiozyma monospora]
MSDQLNVLQKFFDEGLEKVALLLTSIEKVDIKFDNKEYDEARVELHKVTKLLKNSKVEDLYENETQALQEVIYEENKAIGDELQGLRDQFERWQKEIDQGHQDFETIHRDIDGVNAKFHADKSNAIQNDLQDITDMLDDVQKDMDEVGFEVDLSIEMLQKDIAAHKKFIAGGRTNVSALEDATHEIGDTTNEISIDVAESYNVLDGVNSPAMSSPVGEFGQEKPNSLLGLAADERPEVLTVDVIATAPAEVLSTTSSEFPRELKDDFVEGEGGDEMEDVEAKEKVETPTEDKISTPIEEAGDDVDDGDDDEEDLPSAASEDLKHLKVSESDEKGTTVETSDVEPLPMSDVAGLKNVEDQEDKSESISEKKAENGDEIKTEIDDDESTSPVSTETKPQSELIMPEHTSQPTKESPELPLDPVLISTSEELPITTIEDAQKSSFKLDSKSTEENTPTTIDSPVSRDSSSSRTVATTTSTHTTPSETNNDKLEDGDESIEDKVNKENNSSINNNSRQSSQSSALNAANTTTNNNNSILLTPTSQSQSQSHTRSLPQPQQILHSRSGSLAESLGTLIVSPGGGASGAGPALSLGLSASKSLPSVDLNSDSVVASDHLVRKSTSVASSLRLGDAIKFSSSTGANGGGA